MEFCLVKRDLLLDQRGQVCAVRDFWDATPGGVKLTEKELRKIAQNLNKEQHVPEIDFVICTGSFAQLLIDNS